MFKRIPVPILLLGLVSLAPHALAHPPIRSTRLRAAAARKTPARSLVCPTLSTVSPSYAVQKTTPQVVRITLTGGGFAPTATVSVNFLSSFLSATVRSNTVNVITADLTIPAPSAVAQAGLYDVKVDNHDSGLTFARAVRAFELRRFGDSPGNCTDQLDVGSIYAPRDHD
jgi:hypothetical protein